MGGADDGTTSTCDQDTADEPVRQCERGRSGIEAARLAQCFLGSVKRDGKPLGFAYSAHEPGARGLFPDSRDEGTDSVSGAAGRDVEGGEYVICRWAGGGIESGADGGDGCAEEGESTAISGEKGGSQGGLAAVGKGAIPVSGRDRLRLCSV